MSRSVFDASSAPQTHTVMLASTPVSSPPSDKLLQECCFNTSKGRHDSSRIYVHAGTAFKEAEVVCWDKVILNGDVLVLVPVASA